VILALSTAGTACGSAGIDRDSSSESSNNSSSGADVEAELDELYGSGPILTGDASSGAAGASGDDDSGYEDSSCLRIASFGSSSQAGVVPGSSGPEAIVTWLNDFSNAEAQHFADSKDLNEELLDMFDVVLLQDISDWKVTVEAADALESWVRGGGAVFSLAGYLTDSTEVLSRNEFLSFTGMHYASFTSGGDTALNLGQCSYCLGTTYRQGGWKQEHAIARGVEAVGAYQGRSIQGDGEVVASEEGKIYAMAKRVDEGRVFLFHDDWVSHPSQWYGEPIMACSDNPECAEAAPQTSYQVPLFWRNSLSWLSGDSGCFDLVLE